MPWDYLDEDELWGYGRFAKKRYFPILDCPEELFGTNPEILWMSPPSGAGPEEEEEDDGD